MSELTSRKCIPCEGGVDPLKPVEVENLLKQLSGWTLDGRAIAKTYSFRNFHETMAFVNASAWISHREDHHPDMTVGYNSVRGAYTTHAIGGLSQNDFICAAKIDKLFEL
jgi:4a-hydroxytetrahydrobiopterin dehydratase